MSTGPRPVRIELHQQSRVLEVGFDTGEVFHLPCEYLRVHSPSAEVQGHGPSQRVLQVGKQHVGIKAITPIGNYAIGLHFDDGHDTGLFSWGTLYDLGRNQAEYWQKYLDEMEAAQQLRDPPAGEHR